VARLLHAGDVEPLLVAEVVVEQRLRHPDLRRDLVHRHVRVAALGEQPVGDPQGLLHPLAPRHPRSDRCIHRCTRYPTINLYGRNVTRSHRSRASGGLYTAAYYTPRDTFIRSRIMRTCIMQLRMKTLVTNPFRFGALALDESFTDRERERKGLVGDIRNGQDVVLYAPRRLGKSSLVWNASQAAAPDGVLVPQVDGMTPPTKERLAAALATTIFEQIASPLERVKETALAPFRRLQVQPTVTVEDDGSYAFSFQLGRRATDIDATLERLLRLPGELAG